MEQSGSVVDEVRYDAPPQVEFPEILVGKDQVRIARGIAGQGSVNVEHAGEFPSSCWSGDRSERVGVRGHPKILCGTFEQEVEVGGHDRRYAATVRELDQRAMDRRRAARAWLVGVV